MRKTANCNEENKAPYLEHSFPGEVVHTFNHSIQHAEGGSKDSLAYRGSSRPVKATQGRYKDFPWLTNLLKTPEITLGKMFFLWGRTKGKSRRKCQSGLSEVKHEVVMPCLLSPLPPEFISGSRMAESIWYRSEGEKQIAQSICLLFLYVTL